MTPHVHINNVIPPKCAFPDRRKALITRGSGSCRSGGAAGMPQILPHEKHCAERVAMKRTSLVSLQPEEGSF